MPLDITRPAVYHIRMGEMAMQWNGRGSDNYITIQPFNESSQQQKWVMELYGPGWAIACRDFEYDPGYLSPVANLVSGNLITNKSPYTWSIYPDVKQPDHYGIYVQGGYPPHVVLQSAAYPNNGTVTMAQQYDQFLNRSQLWRFDEVKKDS